MSSSGYQLVNAVARACGLADETGNWVLVSTSAIDLAKFGAVGVVEMARANNALFTSTSEVSLETLIVVSANDTDYSTLWVVDGWAVIQAHGRALDLRGARLVGADLAGADLRGADISEADLSRADLTKADLTGATLIGTCFAGATLFSASLKDANLTQADFCRSDLRHADLRNTICRRTAFRGADLWGTYMWKVDVSEAFVKGADLTRSDYLAEEVHS